MIDEQLVLQGYKGEKVIAAYETATQKGLWKEEKVLFDEYIKADDRVLDVGCGTGRTTIPLSFIAREVVGVDFSDEMIVSAIRLAIMAKSTAIFQVANALALPFQASEYEAIVFAYNGLNTIPGQRNRQKALEEIYRVLKSGGTFIFSSHIRRRFDKLFFYWLKQKISIYLLPFLNKNKMEDGDRLSFRLGRYQYINIPTFRTLEKQLRKSGFLIQEMKDKDTNEYPMRVFVCIKN